MSFIHDNGPKPLSSLRPSFETDPQSLLIRILGEHYRCNDHVGYRPQILLLKRDFRWLNAADARASLRGTYCKFLLPSMLGSESSNHTIYQRRNIAHRLLHEAGCTKMIVHILAKGRSVEDAPGRTQVMEAEILRVRVIRDISVSVAQLVMKITLSLR